MDKTGFVEWLRLHGSVGRQYIKALWTRPPLYLTFDTTYRCNLKCVTCPIWQDVPVKKDREAELTKDEICSIVDDACRNIPDLCIRFMGGEPLLRPDIPEIVAYVKQKGIRTEIVTNGTLISEAMAEQLVESGLDNLRISVDAVGPALDQIRGAKDVWGRIATGVANVRAAQSRRGSSLPKITFSCTVSKLNIENLRDVYFESRRLGVEFNWYPAVVFHEHRETSGHSKPPPLPYALDAKDRAAIRKQVYLMSRDGSNGRRPIRDMSRVVARWGFDQLKHNLKIGKTCSWVYPFITVDPYGEVVPCRKMDKCSFGNVRTAPIHAIHAGEKRKQFLEKLRRAPHRVCRECEKGFQWWGYLQLIWHGARARSGR